jgi:antitoxin (DNA-binding transcriptional repressor) of toxin-antitoxin stability system
VAVSQTVVRAERGEPITIGRGGKPVVVLGPLARSRLTALAEEDPL